MYCTTRWNEQSAGYPGAAMAWPRIWLCMLGVSQTVSFGGFGMVDMMPESLFMSVYQGLLGQRRCSFCQHCAVRIAVFRQVNEMCFPDCESASPVFCKM